MKFKEGDLVQLSDEGRSRYPHQGLVHGKPDTGVITSKTSGSMMGIIWNHSGMVYYYLQHELSMAKPAVINKYEIY